MDGRTRRNGDTSCIHAPQEHCVGETLPPVHSKGFHDTKILESLRLDAVTETCGAVCWFACGSAKAGEHMNGSLHGDGTDHS